MLLIQVITNTCNNDSSDVCPVDINACVWLENYLANWNRTLLVVSHNREFLNNIVQEIIHFHNKKLVTYKGNYDMFEKVWTLVVDANIALLIVTLQTRNAKMLQQQRDYDRQQKERSHMQKFVDKLRYKSTLFANTHPTIQTEYINT